MEGRTEYDENDILNLLNKINSTPAKDIPTLLQEYPNLTPIIKTVYNFVKDNAMICACYGLLTNNITLLDVNRFKKILPDLKSKLKLTDSSPLIKSMSAILMAIQFNAECIARGSYKLNLSSDCYFNLSGASFFNAQFNGNISYSKLTGTSFRSANLSHSNLAYCDLTDADFSDCNLTNVNLTGANFTNAKFDRATLTGIHFFETENIEAELDRLSSIIKKHPNIAQLRAAIATDLHKQIHDIELYNKAYKHPIFNQHRDLRGIRSFINTIHSWFAPKDGHGRVARNLIETSSQKTLFSGRK